MRSARSICRADGWSGRSATPWGFQLESAEDGHLPAHQFLNPTAGPGVLPLTYTQASAFPADVLADGRILFEAGFPLGSGSTPELYLVYADGSGVESYRCDHGRARWGGTQLASGDVVFTHGDSLARFTSPLAHEVKIDAPRAEYAGAMAETASGAWLVSARAGAGARFALKLWKPGAAALETVFAVSGEESCRAGSACAAHSAQTPSLRSASMGLRQYACARCAPLARRGFEEGSRIGATGEDDRRRPDDQSQARRRLRRTDLFSSRFRPTSRFGLPCSMKRARCCARSTDGSGYGGASSASAWAATRDRSVHRRIACRTYCCARRRRLI